MNDQVKNAAIQQLNISYMPTEDRLLLKIGMSNQTELSVWLTYRVTRTLAKVLQTVPVKVPADERVNTPYNQALEQQFAKQEISQKLNFSSDYEQRSSLNKGQLFLVVDCVLTENDSQQQVLNLVCANRQTVSLALNNELLLGLTNMLKQAGNQAEWFADLQTSLTASDSNTLLH